MSDVTQGLSAIEQGSTHAAGQLLPIKAEVVKLRFFAGLTMPEVAQSLDISLATAERYWAYARTWLYAELAEDQD